MAGTLVITTLSDGTKSTSSTNCIQGSAKAWVRFATITGAGVVNASYNVSSITYNGTGDCTINFTNAFTDANYCAVGMSNDPAAPVIAIRGANPPTTTALRLWIGQPNVTTSNVTYGNVAVFR
jgi:hypothetical protein